MFYRFLIVIIASFQLIAYAQELTPNQYGLYVVTDKSMYNKLVEKNSNKTLVDLEKFIPGIMLDIRYATDNNFYGEPVYNIHKAFARLPVAKALKNIQEELKSRNLGLKIYDAYRPYSVTVKFYDKIKGTIYLATPWNGSRHNRGCSVDLTLVDLTTGNEIIMPTEYDNFTEKAGHNYMKLEPDAIANRKLLKEVMTKHGFLIYSAEWWHYDYADWKNYELMDLSFEDLLSEF
jgi:D-alanyl-D-alanine dipeptidase